MDIWIQSTVCFVASFNHRLLLAQLNMPGWRSIREATEGLVQPIDSYITKARTRKQPIILLQQKSWTKCLSNSYKLTQVHQNLHISSTMPFLRMATTSLFRLLILLPLSIKRDIITWKNCRKDCAVLVSYAHTLVDLYVRNYLFVRPVPEPVTLEAALS